MKNEKTRMIAPVIITILTIAYFIAYFTLIISTIDGIIKYAMAIVPLALSVTMLFVCKQRIDEIKKGEDNDISKY